MATKVETHQPFEPGLEKLGGLTLEEFRDESNKKALVVTDDSKAKVRAIATQWRDQDRRKKFLEDANITDEKQVAAMWEATEAWLTHASSAIPERLISFVDPAVKKLMPANTVIESVEPHGLSSWSRSACIETTVDGERVAYFLKATPSISGKIMFEGECEGIKAIYDALPGFCPEAVGTGMYESEKGVYFLLQRFVDMIEEPPDPETLPEKLAEMHKNGEASDGMYGFHVPTTAGLLPIHVAKGRSWEDYFTRYIKYCLLAEQLAQGPPEDPEYTRLTKIFLERIIPRLLRPLETGGREIQPRLTHTDIWHGNTGIDNDDGRPVIFDPCPEYGHNERDLGVWTCPRMTYGPIFLTKYQQFFPRSSPEEDYESRILLYLCAFEIRVSVTVVGTDHFRREFLGYISELDKKHPETYEEWAKARGEEPQPMKTP